MSANTGDPDSLIPFADRADPGSPSERYEVAGFWFVAVLAGGRRLFYDRGGELV
jgi:hypothetical protein